jgi:hypothetical protein
MNTYKCGHLCDKTHSLNLIDPIDFLFDSMIDLFAILVYNGSYSFYKYLCHLY